MLTRRQTKSSSPPDQRCTSKLMSRIGLPPKARVGILTHQEQKIVDRYDLWSRLVAMPLQIGTLPKDPPHVSSSHVGSLGYRMLHLFARGAPPNGADFEDHDTLSLNVIAKVESWSDVRRWTLLLNEGAHRFLDTRHFEFAQRHLGRCLTSALSGPREAIARRRGR